MQGPCRGAEAIRGCRHWASQGGQAGVQPSPHPEQPLVPMHRPTQSRSQTIPGDSHPGLPLGPAGHVALDLSLVDAVHGEPDQRAAQHEGPDRVPAPRVWVEAGHTGDGGGEPWLAPAPQHPRGRGSGVSTQQGGGDSLAKVHPGAVGGDAQHPSGTPHQQHPADDDGDEAGEHHEDLEDVRPDDSLHPALRQTEP